MCIGTATRPFSAFRWTVVQAVGAELCVRGSARRETRAHLELRQHLNRLQEEIGVSG